MPTLHRLLARQLDPTTRTFFSARDGNGLLSMMDKMLRVSLAEVILRPGAPALTSAALCTCQRRGSRESDDLERRLLMCSICASFLGPTAADCRTRADVITWFRLQKVDYKACVTMWEVLQGMDIKLWLGPAKDHLRCLVVSDTPSICSVVCTLLFSFDSALHLCVSFSRFFHFC